MFRFCIPLKFIRFVAFIFEFHCNSVTIFISLMLGYRISLERAQMNRHVNEQISFRSLCTQYCEMDVNNRREKIETFFSKNAKFIVNLCKWLRAIFNQCKEKNKWFSVYLNQFTVHNPNAINGIYLRCNVHCAVCTRW